MLKQHDMQTLYDSIGSSYSTTRRADPDITQELAQFVGIENGSDFLDLACGTGNYTCALAAIGGKWYGIDISEIMLKQAAEKNPSMEWMVGSANALPFRDGSFEGAVCSLAVHHFPELVGPFQEVWRVLNRGHFVIFTAFPEQMKSYWLCHYFPEMMCRSIKDMPTREFLVTILQSAGFEIKKIIPFYVTNRLQDLFLYSGKKRPEFYFDPAVRANISSFASCCPHEELHEGLRTLRADLDSGQFQHVEQRYSSAAGDYAYIVAHKRCG